MSATLSPTSTVIDVQKIREEFPMLRHKQNGKPLIYFDSASTNHKPKRVLDRLYEFYSNEYAKPNESHSLSQQATKLQEQAREQMADFIGASHSSEIVFSRGCTESINMVAGGFMRAFLKEADEIILTELEHHANIVPWQFACQYTGAKLRVVPILPDGSVDQVAYENAFSSRTRIVTISHSSNAIGTVLPVKAMVNSAHQRGIPVMVDGAQYAPHAPVDVTDLGCDFYTFSGHKMGMPSGVGILYGRKEWLEKLPPYEGGGDMVKKVDFFSAPEPETLPKKFEAGTMPFAEIIAMGTLIDYLNELDMRKTSTYELELLEYATERISDIKEVTVVGTATEKEPILSFTLDGMDVKKLERFLNDEYNIDVRAGELAAQPLMKALHVSGLLRASLCYYNTHEEIDVFVSAVERFVAEKS